jgi:MoaA/NifB/PqqE/SkfB family radical SAM enzyme
MRLSAGKRLKKRGRLRFDVQLADHCNLNCTGCSNYSPIAPKNFLKKESFNKNCERLSLLSGGNLEDIYLFGGEPLLHPGITEIIKIARRHFQKTDIVILTNGILLPKMGDEFWDCCREYNIKITITKYPVKIDIASIKEIAKKFSVKLNVFYEKTERKFFFRPLNLKNPTDAKKNFLFCSEANRCIILRNGRLSCTTASNIEILNNAIMSNGGFGVFEITENDYIDIYKAKSLDEILDFLARPMPFCRYCDYSKRSFGRKWSVSEKKLSEWILEEICNKPG